MLNSDKIRSALPSQTAFSYIEIFDQIPSTNTYLLALPAAERQTGRICLAEEQTAGRGRFDRKWISPAKKNIYLSFLWKLPLEKRQGITLVIGFAIAQLLRDIGLDAKIKWPNDILIHEKKVAGILVEAVADYVVIGIGLNVNMTEQDLNPVWTSLLQEMNQELERNKLVGELLNNLEKALVVFEKKQLNHIFENWSAFDALKEGKVYVEQGGEKISGIAKGIEKDGALLVKTETEIIRICSGEIQKILF